MASAGARRPVTRRRVVAVLVVTLALLAGCTAAPPAPKPTSAATPAAPPVDPVQQYADDRLSVMTLDEKIRSMLMIQVPGLDASYLGAVAEAEGLGGLILMGGNVPDPPGALATMTDVMEGEDGLPILIGMDQEGGVVRRVFTDTSASAIDLRYLAPASARDAFHDRSELLESLGVTVNFGIVADVAADPASFIFERSFGGTATDAAARVAAAVAGEHGTVLSTLKHFPGHGVSPGDSHSSVPTTTMGMEEWWANHAPPFKAGIEAGAEFVMMGHLQFDSVDPQPASLSAGWVGILRTELGFDGIIITDDLSMLQASGRPDLADPLNNAVRAVAAGNTMLLYVGPVDVGAVVTAIRTAVLDGRIDESVINDAARRLLVLRRTISGETGRLVHCFEECLAIIR
jgi:beta-N-acetylhexosaminidase